MTKKRPNQGHAPQPPQQQPPDVEGIIHQIQQVHIPAFPGAAAAQPQAPPPTAAAAAATTTASATSAAASAVASGTASQTQHQPPTTSTTTTSQGRKINIQVQKKPASGQPQPQPQQQQAQQNLAQSQQTHTQAQATPAASPAPLAASTPAASTPTAAQPQPHAEPGGGKRKGKGKGKGQAQQQGAVTTTTATAAATTGTATTSSAVATTASASGEVAVRRRRPRAQDDYYLAGLPPTPAPSRKDGMPLQVLTNHFLFEARNTEFYQYQINFNPMIPSRSMRIALVHEHLWSALGPFIFDGTMFFATRRVPEGDHKLTTKTKQVHIATVVFTTIVRPGTPQVFQLFNIHLRKLLVKVLHLKAIGRNWFNDASPKRIPGIPNVELWSGVVATLFPAAGAPFFTLNIDLAHKVIRLDTVAQELMQIWQTVGQNVELYKAKANEELPGQTVLTRYTKANSRTYMISHLDWERSPTSTFQNDQGQQMSFVEYYKQHYGITLRALTPPLIAIKQGEGFIYLMPELCFMTGLSESMRKNFSVMKSLADYTRINSATRASEIMQIVGNQLNSPAGKAQMAEFSAALSPNFMTVNARRIAPENIIFGRNQINRGVDNASWGNILGRMPPLSVASAGTMAVVFPERLQGDAVNLVNALAATGAPMGFQFRAVSIPLQYDRRDDYLRALQQAVSSPEVQFILCILFNEAKDKYDAIKQFLTSEASARPSQVVLAKSLDPRKINTVCQRVLLQINVKLGGELWTVDIPLKDTMICGVDVCHSRGRSVLGFVGTTNATFSKYHANVAFHEKGQEVSTALKPLMIETLKGYFAANKSLPKRVFVYRDGVGDGMLQQVLEKEVTEFESAFASFPGYHPKLTVIVVKKRIHTRLFLTNFGNPGPGTIVDSGCTHKGWYDFYVVSNAVTQGSVTPTHYHVIRDENQLTEAQMQTLSFKLTHMYYNWPGTIRVPAPCQYAHKLAFLVGQNTQRAPVSHLCDKLFFL
ncbi:piwi A [Pelomyxa schiedti]|nr:piwi A [Pelomyxa schiedti]